MRIALPLVGERLSEHFGHCETFALIDVDEKTGTIAAREDVVPPPHEPGVLPKFLAEKDAQVVITGGMGPRALELFAQRDIRVILGAPAESPEKVVRAYLSGSLENAGNACTHEDGHVCEG